MSPMASQPENVPGFKYLKIKTAEVDSSSSLPHQDTMDIMTYNTEAHPQRPKMKTSFASSETIRATPPMNIPSSHETIVPRSDSPSDFESGSYMDHYMRNRKSPMGRDEDDSDNDRHAKFDEMRQKSSRDGTRARSLLHELTDERARVRAQNDSDRDYFDPEQSPQYSSGSSREQAHVGEPRFPLLQDTVDEMARTTQPTPIPQATSMTSQSTMSPVTEEVHTPQDDEPQYPISPLPISPRVMHAPSSLESLGPRSFRRTASQRWRDGEGAQDFFSRAGSLRKRDGSFKSSSRRNTASSYASNSVASSFLRGFSVNSGDGEGSGQPAVDAEGQTIGEDYVLGKEIGFGGFSTVKEVTQLAAGSGKQRKLAAKIVRRSIEGKSESENDTVQAEFDHEVELWRFLSHKNILPLEAVYKLDEATFCFIPLNTGGTLFDLVRTNRGGVRVDLARSYAYQLAQALRYLHLDVHVVHRDVKLENCLIETAESEPGLLRLCDFGMAEWIESDQDRSSSTDRPVQKVMGPADTSSSAFVGGSLEYAAPEILRLAHATSPSSSSSGKDELGDPENVQRSVVSTATDIWAFGVCLYSMIAGKRPFTHTFQPRIITAILAGEWDRDIVLEKTGGDQELLNLLEGCLNMDQYRRLDIRAVLDSEWFDEERYKSDDSQTDEPATKWRL